MRRRRRGFRGRRRRVFRGRRRRRKFKNYTTSRGGVRV